MSVLINNNGSLVRQDAAAIAQLAAVDTEGILGGTPGATTGGQTLVDQLAADDVQAQTDIGQIKTDLSDKLDIADEQVLGAWNTLKNDATTQTTEGATFTVNSDSTITINRASATANAALINITNGGNITETRESGTYYLSGVPSGSSGLTIQYYDVTANLAWNDSGSGATITVVKGHTVKVTARVAPNLTLSNVTIKPMIALKPNMPYVPYAMTNRELTAGFIKCSKYDFSYTTSLTGKNTQMVQVNVNEPKTRIIAMWVDSSSTNDRGSCNYVDTNKIAYVLITNEMGHSVAIPINAHLYVLYI